MVRVNFPHGAGTTWSGDGVILLKYKHNATSTTGWRDLVPFEERKPA